MVHRMTLRYIPIPILCETLYEQYMSHESKIRLKLLNS